MTPAEIDRVIFVAKWQTEGTDPNAADWAYWREKAPELIARGYEIHFRSPRGDGTGDPGRDYFYEKLIGWQATGADLPHYGPYSPNKVAFHSVPEGAPPPDPEPAPTPAPAPVIDLSPVLAELAAINAQLANVATKDDLRDIRNELITAAKSYAGILGLFRRGPAPPVR